MRELKFRVWSEEDKEYRSDIKVSDLVIDKDGAPSTIYNNEGDRFDIEQYTGLKDKNGKEIYEGDIVRYSHKLLWNTPAVSSMTAVDWWSGEEEHYPCCTTSGFALPYSEDGYEVIGNIHENPELIGKEQ